MTHPASIDKPLNLTNCDREPIHVPSSIQPHGVLLTLAEPDLRVLQASENVAAWLGVEATRLLGKPLSDAIGSERAEQLRPGLLRAPHRERPVLLAPLHLVVQGSPIDVHPLAHRSDGCIVLELERIGPGELSPPSDDLGGAFSLKVEQTQSLAQLCELTAAEIQQLTGFDRVLIYRFDEQHSGAVIGEAGNGRLPSLMDHRFPASDIPAPARELYRLNRLRLIPDSGYRPVPIVPALHPETGWPIDLSFSTLRSVSPVHVEYMRNMRTASSMSVSILRDGRLWGLISCHHTEPKQVAFPLRSLCDLYARMFSLRLAALEHGEDYERRIEVRSAFSKLLAAMADRLDYTTALTEDPQSLLALANATGAAVVAEDACLLIGQTPSETEVDALARWLFRSQAEAFHTDSLPAVFAGAQAYQDRACGLLAVAVSKLHPNYVMWFRPEVIQTIRWGGNPNKPVTPDGDGLTLHPRRSFETWKETVRDKSLAWKRTEIEGAQELRNAIVEIVLRKTEELAKINSELTRSNHELEAFSYSVSHDLRAPLRHIAGFAEMLKDDRDCQLSEKGSRYVDTIIESSEYAGVLVDKLLAFSRMGRAHLDLIPIDMNQLVADAQQQTIAGAPDRAIDWRIGKLPTVQGDVMMLRDAVRNLLENAAKYTRRRDHARIEVGCREEADEYVFWVKDNGVGFDQQYADKLFGVFQRLHRMEDFEGTGIGLANVRRVIERHGGRTWAEGQEGVGATFYFTLPIPRS